MITPLDKLRFWLSCGLLLASVSLQLDPFAGAATTRKRVQLSPAELDKLGSNYLTGRGVRRDPARAHQCFLKAAHRGYAAAEYHLARMLESGDGIRKNPKRAFHLAKRAAHKGFSEAQNHLGWMYQNGIGTKRDAQLAMQWFQKGANNGSAAAQYNVGVCFEKGSCAKPNPSKAAQWFLKAAQNGNANAQFMLGVFYTLGFGVKQDFDEGHKWFQIANCPTRSESLRQTAGRFHCPRTTAKQLERWFTINWSRAVASSRKLVNDWMP